MRDCPPSATTTHGAATTPAEELSLEVALSAMFGVMLNVVVIMIAGYWLAENKGLTAQARAGLSIYIGWCALPALFFNTLSAENFLEAEGAVLLAVSLAKLAMIVFSIIGGWATQRFRQRAPGMLEMRAGIFALLTTNGDEVGLGVPTISALFPSKLPLLFVLAGIQKLIFLPIALVLLGAGAAKREGKGASPTELLMHVIAEKARDPLVLGIFGGLAFNILGPALHPPCEPSDALHGLWQSTGYAPGLLGGAQLPSYVENLCKVLGTGFTPTIFLLTGAASVGTWSTLADVGELPKPLVLVILKSLVLPTLARFILSCMGASKDSLDFVFVFCLFSASGANMVYVMAKNPNEHQKTILMANLSLSKIIAFPLLLIVPVIFFANDAKDVEAMLESVGGLGCVLALLLGVWYFISANRHALKPHITWNVFVAFEILYTLVRVLKAPGRQLIGWSADAALIFVSALHILNLRVGDHRLGHMDEAESPQAKNFFNNVVLEGKAESVFFQNFEGATGSSKNLLGGAAAASSTGNGGYELLPEEKPAAAEEKTPDLLLPRRAATTAPSATPLQREFLPMANGEANRVVGITRAQTEKVVSSSSKRSTWQTELADAVRTAGGEAELEQASWLYILGVLTAAVVPGMLMTFLSCYGAALSCDDTSRPLSGNALLFGCTGFAVFALFAVLMQHDGALQLHEYNPKYHLFLQRLAILLLVICTQLILSAALLGGFTMKLLLDHEEQGLATPSGSVAFMLLVVQLLRNFRLILVFVLFGLSRAKADLSAAIDTLRAWGVLPRPALWEKPSDDANTEGGKAMFPLMY